MADVLERSPCTCRSAVLERLFQNPSLPMKNLVNSEGRKIDIQTKTVFNGSHWKGFYPPDTPLPPWIFQNSFNKAFRIENASVKGVTSTFDDFIRAANALTPIDLNDPSRGVLLEYTEPQFSMFYGILKVIDDNVVIGKAYTGKYPIGTQLLVFSMARRYSFNFMSPEDHRELFAKYGKAPDANKVLGIWEGRMVSNASLTPPLFRFRYEVDSSGKVTCRWNLMSILKGDSQIEFTRRQMLMFDFTNFHDEIRMIADDAMVGKYCPVPSEIMNLIGDRSLGLIHFEKTPMGTRPCVYYYIKRVAGQD